ncbi:class II aldolase/adducin family protein [Duganella radicis]|uniref:Class II aldolase/adducin family protein n=1 Tax=Duganella radicis TaxID=551988 RepID=A0A6L6PQ41_9BURK|nr:class II aldolase/adducin family protein [Duganella radicis]MTV41228.1 class II aldolase/adducin family protein [Duganella radicis]
MSSYTTHKAQVIDACLTLANAGYLAGTGGNLALRINHELFAVTPSGADYYALKPDDICVLRLDTLEQVEGSLKPSVESAMHACMLRFKRDMQASVHTHQPLASAVALLNIDLPVQDEAQRRALGERVAIVPYAPSGTGLLVRAFRRKLRANLHGYLLKNHGVICAAPDMTEAIAHVGRIEAAAADFLRRRIAAANTAPAAVRQMALAALNTHP